jgi:hypothetical protein
MTEQPDWLKAHYDNTCATRARGDNLAGIATAIGGLIELRHAQEEALIDTKIELIQDELVRAGATARAEIGEGSFAANLRDTLVKEPSEVVDLNIDRYPGIKDPVLRAFLRRQDVYYGHAEPETDEERKLVKQRSADLAQDYHDRVWKTGHYAGTRRGPTGGPRYG